MDDTFTIQISSDLISRLTDDSTKSKRTIKVKPKSSPEQHHKPRGTTNPASTPENHSSPPQPRSLPPVSRSPHSPAIGELEAIRSSLQESEMAVEKIEKQEADMAQLLAQRAKELREKEFKLPYQKPIHCLNEREACLQCYKEHLEDPLKCAPLVQKFAECARQARQKVGHEAAGD